MTISGQPQVSYSYNDADDLTAVTRGTISVALTYDDADRPQSITLPDGIVQSYTYDSASDLTGITYQSGQTTLGDLVYGYDANGLRRAIGGAYARTNLPAAINAATYDVNNRLTGWGGATNTYDDNGNLTGDGTKTYSWNARDQLIALSGGGTSAGFAYDGFGRRRSTTLNGTETKYLSDGDSVAQELDSTGAVQANLIAGLGVDDLFATVSPTGSTTTVLTDPLGSTIALADAAGTVQTSYTTTPSAPQPKAEQRVSLTSSPGATTTKQACNTTAPATTTPPPAASSPKTRSDLVAAMSTSMRTSAEAQRTRSIRTGPTP